MTAQQQASAGEVPEWLPLETCPQDGETYVLFRFPQGSSPDRECPNVAVGKRYAMRDEYWLTAIWAASAAHVRPDAWMPLPRYIAAHEPATVDPVQRLAAQICVKLRGPEASSSMVKEVEAMIRVTVAKGGE